MKPDSETSLFLDCNSLFSICATDIPKEIYRFLKMQLGHFARNNIENSTKKADIYLLELTEMPLSVKTVNRWDLLFGFHFDKYRNEKAIFFNHRGIADVIICFSDIIKIYYRNRPNVSRKIYGILLFCISLTINRKNGILVHGAVAQNDSNCLLLFGHRGSGKTSLLLTMLNHGWDFISDDKFILYDGKAWLYQKIIPVRSHHFDTLPWLNKKCVGPGWSKRWLGAGRFFAGFAGKYVHKHILPLVDRCFNPTFYMPADSLHTETEILASGAPSIVIYICVGDKIQISEISKDEIIELMALTQEMAYHESAQTRILLNLHIPWSRYNTRKIIKENINAERFIKLSLPDSADIYSAYKEIEKWIKQVS